MIRCRPVDANRSNRARAASGVPWIQRVRRSSSHASPSANSSGPNASRSVRSRASRSSGVAPMRIPTIADRASVAGSRPIAAHASSSERCTSTTRSGDAELRLNSSAKRAAIRYDRGVPWPPTMIRGRAPWAVLGRPATSTGRGRNRASSRRRPLRPSNDQPSGSAHRPCRIASWSSSMSARRSIGGKARPVLAVLGLVPAGADAELDAAAAHLVDRHRDLGHVAGESEGDRRDERAEMDPRGVAGQAGQDRPGIRRGAPAGPGKTGSGRTGRAPRTRPPRLAWRHRAGRRRTAPAGARSSRRTARRLSGAALQVDRMIHMSTIIHVTRTISSAVRGRRPRRRRTCSPPSSPTSGRR